MLTGKQMAGAILTAFDLEMYSYAPERMKMLFSTLGTKTPEYVDDFLSFLLNFSDPTKKLYLEIMFNYTEPYGAITFRV